MNKVGLKDALIAYKRKQELLASGIGNEFRYAHKENNGDIRDEVDTDPMDFYFSDEIFTVQEELEEVFENFMERIGIDTNAVLSEELRTAINNVKKSIVQDSIDGVIEVYYKDTSFQSK